jgi:hypothetical protein
MRAVELRNPLHPAIAEALHIIEMHMGIDNGEIGHGALPRMIGLLHARLMGK